MTTLNREAVSDLQPSVCARRYAGYTQLVVGRNPVMVALMWCAIPQGSRVSRVNPWAFFHNRFAVARGLFLTPKT